MRFIVVGSVCILACGGVHDDGDAAPPHDAAPAIDAPSEAEIVDCDGGDYVSITSGASTTVIHGGCGDAGPSVARALCRNVPCNRVSACDGAGAFSATVIGSFPGEAQAVIDWADAGVVGNLDMAMWPSPGGTASGTFDGGALSGSFCVKRLN